MARFLEEMCDAPSRNRATFQPVPKSIPNFSDTLVGVDFDDVRYNVDKRGKRYRLRVHARHPCSGGVVVADANVRERFGKLLEDAGQMCWELDRAFRVVYANDLLIKTFGNPVGKVCHDFMACSEDVCPECPVKRIFEGEERASSERMRFDKQGKRVWLQHTATPVRNDSGEVVGALELTVDTTQRKQTEEWLKDSERLYRNLVEQVPDVIFSLDELGRFTFVNTHVELFLGYPVEKILETPLTDYVIPEDRERVLTIPNLKPEAIWDEEIGILDATGRKKFARIRCKASFASGEQTHGVRGRHARPNHQKETGRRTEELERSAGR